MIRPEDLSDEVLEATVAEEPASDFQAAITDTKKRTLLAALEAAGGNAAAAARSLGLHPNSFRRLLRQLGLREGNE
jgi:transcriptional regulator of acetoin/glycerol metabolism